MTDSEFDDLMWQLRKQKGFCPLTSEEAQHAYEEAEAVPISEERVQEIVDFAIGKTAER